MSSAMPHCASVTVSVGQSQFVAIRQFERLPEHPLLTIANAIQLLETTSPTAAKAISTLVESGVLIESSNRKRDRTLVYEGYFYLLRVGDGTLDVEPLATPMAALPEQSVSAKYSTFPVWHPHGESNSDFQDENLAS